MWLLYAGVKPIFVSFTMPHPIPIVSVTIKNDIDAM